jgi:hypothetical protein
MKSMQGCNERRPRKRITKTKDKGQLFITKIQFVYKYITQTIRPVNNSHTSGITALGHAKFYSNEYT